MQNVSTSCPRNRALALAGLPADAISRFERHIDRRGEQECWEWTRSKRGSGYGQFVTKDPRTSRARAYAAHRLAYFLATGDDPGDLAVLHTCDNPACCNPKHLVKGTQADNMQDKARKGRGRGPRPPRVGLKQAELIRKDNRSYSALAAAYGYSWQVIATIKRGKTWVQGKDYSSVRFAGLS